ncbi:MAG: GtrA family protein [bacterium]|nr:GtrA family protein [bacterium]
MKNSTGRQIWKFLVVGGLAFLLDYVLLYICTECFKIYVMYSSIIAFCISVIFNYVLSIKWVFTAKNKQTIKEFLIFIILSIIGLLLNQVIMDIGIKKFYIHYMIVKIISTSIVMIYNFITRKIFIEKRGNNNGKN